MPVKVAGAETECALYISDRLELQGNVGECSEVSARPTCRVAGLTGQADS